MTTKVTVDAHAGWPVKVTAIDKGADDHETVSELGIVSPNTVQDFYVHSGRNLLIEELPQT